MNELEQWLADDKASGRRAARFAAQAEFLRTLKSGSRDSSGNTVETMVANLEAAAR